MAHCDDCGPENYELGEVIAKGIGGLQWEPAAYDWIADRAAALGMDIREFICRAALEKADRNRVVTHPRTTTMTGLG